MKQKGFTLIEAIVSITIIVILAGITLANYADIRTGAQVDSDIEVVVGALRGAQAEALSPERSVFDGLSPSDRLCSIGVRFNATTNQIQPQYRSVSSAIGDCSSPSVDVRDYGESSTPAFTSLTGSDITLFFDAPFGGLSAASTVGNPVEIILQSNQDSSLIRRIRVYRSGIIETQ